MSSKSRYEVIRCLGEGGYGRALLVRQKTNRNKRYVMKEVRLSAMKPKEREEARREAKVLASFNNPNIVRYIESFEESNYFYIVMEYADGGDLAQKIEKRGKKLFSEEEILHDFIQIALAIKYIHDRKILHRDLKAQNVFLMKDGTVKLGDFGIARVLERTMQLCKTQIGTPYYLSPEICEGKRYNSKTDIWSLGCILYELCTLRHPFDAANINGLLMVIIRGKYKPISSMYSDNLRQLLAQLLTRDPAKRPSINQILRIPYIKSKLGKFLDDTLLEYEMGHTILHGRKPLAPPTILLSKDKDENETPEVVNEVREPPRNAPRTPLAKKRVPPRQNPPPSRKEPERNPRPKESPQKPATPLDPEEEKRLKKKREIEMFKLMAVEMENQRKMVELRRKREEEKKLEEQKREEEKKAAEEAARKAAFEQRKKREIAELKRHVEERDRAKREAEMKKKREEEAAERRRIMEEKRQKAKEEEERRRAQLEEENRRKEEEKAQIQQQKEELRQKRLTEIQKKKAAEKKKQALELKRQRQERLERIRMERAHAEEEERMEIARIQEEEERRSRELAVISSCPGRVQQSQSQDKLMDTFISRSQDNTPSWARGPTKHVELEPDDMTIAAPKQIHNESSDDELETLKIPPTNRKKVRIMSQDELDADTRRRIFEENKRERAENKAKMRGTPTDQHRKLSVNDGLYSRPIEELTDKERYELYKMQREERRQNQMKISGNAPPRAGTPGVVKRKEPEPESDDSIDEEMLAKFSDQHNMAVAIRDAYDLPEFNENEEAEAGFEDADSGEMEFSELTLPRDQTVRQRADALRAFLLMKVGNETLKKIFSEIRSYEEDENAETPICNGLDPEVFFMAQQLRFLEDDDD